jgi:hypothetical protein
MLMCLVPMHCKLENGLLYKLIFLTQGNVPLLLLEVQ